MPSLDFWGCSLVLVKALCYAATLGCAGGVLFAGYSHDLLTAQDKVSLEHWLRWLTMIAATASALNILLTAGSMGGEIGSMLDVSLVQMAWSAGQAHATGVRLIGLALMSVSAGPSRPRAAQLAGAMLAATSFAWVGHTHAAPEARLAVLTLAAHLVGAAFWVGALVPLLMVARGADPPRLAALVARFSATAVVMVGTLVAAGACVLWCLLSSVAELWTTLYGRSVMLKLGLVAGLLGLAALNRWRLTPRLRTSDSNARRYLRWSIRLEVIVAAAILMTTAAMTVLTGPNTDP